MLDRRLCIAMRRNVKLEVEIPENHSMLLPLLDLNWHFQCVVSPSPVAIGSATARDCDAVSSTDAWSETEDDSKDEFYRVFKAFDENEDGLISKEEVGKLMAKLGHEMSESDLELLMLTVDLNGDGCVDFEEFHALYANLEDQECSDGEEDDEEDDEDENLKEAFRMFDKNNDGFITAEELHSVLSVLGFVQGGRSVMACENMIRGVDSNGDGLVDFLEFKEMMLARPSPRAYFATMIEAS